MAAEEERVSVVSDTFDGKGHKAFPQASPLAPNCSTPAAISRPWVQVPEAQVNVERHGFNML